MFSVWGGVILAHNARADTKTRAPDTDIGHSWANNYVSLALFRVCIRIMARLSLSWPWAHNNRALVARSLYAGTARKRKAGSWSQEKTWTEGDIGRPCGRIRPIIGPQFSFFCVIRTDGGKTFLSTGRDNVIASELETESSNRVLIDIRPMSISARLCGTESSS